MIALDTVKCSQCKEDKLVAHENAAKIGFRFICKDCYYKLVRIGDIV